MTASLPFEVVDRLQRRALRLEADLSLLLAEIEAVAERVEPAELSAKCQPSHGRRLDVGLDRLFAPEPMHSIRPIEAHERLTERCWFSFDRRGSAPDIRVWRAACGGDAGRRSFVVDLRDRGEAKWLMLEFELDWAQLGEARRLSLMARASCEPSAMLQARLHARSFGGEPLRSGSSGLDLSGEPSVSLAEIDLDPSALADADRNHPPKLQLSFRDLHKARIHFHDLVLSAVAD